ncbi:4841_t:CDS:2 [Entrophospora sp. SA101]|nr:5116_t:CDS:2 [Entrophospora sp. SA101]CAJ0835740.1 4841_t:CDS:2 [Entrophospora sp. SA101]
MQIKIHFLVLSIFSLFFIKEISAQDVNGNCGAKSIGGAVKCLNGFCCSEFGFCGSTAEHCGKGCQSAFGRCGEAAPPAAPNKRIITNCKTPGTVALTFDDGPFNTTRALLKVLKEEKVKATFFVNGDNFRCIYDKDLSDLATLNKSKIVSEMRKLEVALKRITGRIPKHMRPPFGSGVDKKSVVDTITSLGYDIILWDTDSLDASGASVSKSLKIYSKVSGPKKSHIILNHDTVPTTSKVMIRKAIKILKAKGFKFTTVGECLGIKNPDKWYKFVGKPEKRDPKTWKC